MLDSYFTAFGILLQPMNILVLLGGVLVGLVIGVIPTIGSLFILPILLPFTYHMPIEVSLILFTSICAVVFTGGSITSILLNIPGTSPNAATMLDGYPLTRQGQAARAIGAAVMSSMAGGLLPVFLSLATIPILLPMILAFGQPEMAALVLLGLAFMASLSGGSVTRGIISGALGLLLSIVGHQAITGIDRFNFSSILLYDGINIIPLTLGIFGLAELLSLSARGEHSIVGKIRGTRLSGITKGIKDVWRHRWLWLRSTIIGHIIGIIPGIGAEVATWVCYGQAKQTSKNPEEFGTGRIEGVIAPEAANNAGEAGGLLTTLALGIPGSSVMTFFLAALLIAGVSPGPSLMVNNLPLVLALLIAIAVANIIGGIICLSAANQIAKLATVNIDFLIPAIIVVAFAGIYLATSSLANLLVALVFTLLGFFMKQYGYSRPALLLGFVLGGMFENYTLLSFKIYGPSFFLRPISLALLSIAILALLYPGLNKMFRRRKRSPDSL